MARGKLFSKFKSRTDTMQGACDVYRNAPIGVYAHNHSRNLVQVQPPDGKIALICDRCLPEFNQHLHFLIKTGAFAHD